MIEQGKIWQIMVKYGCNMDGICMEEKKMEKTRLFGLTNG